MTDFNAFSQLHVCEEVVQSKNCRHQIGIAVLKSTLKKVPPARQGKINYRQNFLIYFNISHTITPLFRK
jgi:hypothetical protein